MKIKVCGITNFEDALTAANYGADALGFIFYRKSPRYIEPEQAKEIISYLPPFVTTVGVFVNEDPAKIRFIMEFAGLNILQLHGDEPPDLCRIWPRVIKAFRVNDLTELNFLVNYKTSANLLDTYSPNMYGGTGMTFNWEIALEAKRFGLVILSGGLNIDNIEKAIRMVKPYAVDVNSGIESSKGKKDLQKMREFIAKVRAIQRTL
ncbi:MAG: phosphoribosylanthranilate isomerase [Thermodesulfovibrionales bacterium]|nr:phosphoribosylanthranilate isomerase [Thermodesulfovibrionales bacterium]